MLGTFLHFAICVPMDSSEVVYVIARDEDLPVSLQLLHADGRLQPRIVSKSLVPCHSNGQHDITVYDKQQNDVMEDVVIESFEFIVDENGEVFHICNMPDTLPSVNSAASVNSTGYSKLLMPEDTVRESNMVTNLKADDSQIMALLQCSSHMSLHYVQHNCRECDKSNVIVVATESVQASECLNGAPVNSSGNHVLNDSAFPALGVEMTAKTDKNSVSVSVCTANALSLCASKSPSTHSLPASPSNLSVTGFTDKVAADTNCSAASLVLGCLVNAENCCDAVAENTDITLMSHAVNTFSTNAVDCDTVNNVIEQPRRPRICSQKCCSTFCICEGNGHLQQCVNKSGLSCVSTAKLLTEESSCQVVSLLSSVTDNSCSVADAAATSCTYPGQAVTDFSDDYSCEGSMSTKDENIDHKSNIVECHCADNVHKSTASCKSSLKHSIYPCSPVERTSLCKTECHCDDLITSLNVSDFSCTGLPVTASKASHCNVNDCSQSEAMCVSIDVLPVGADSTEQYVSETEMSSSSDNPIVAEHHNSEDSLLPTANCHGSATEEFIENVNAVDKEAYDNSDPSSGVPVTARNVNHSDVNEYNQSEVVCISTDILPFDAYRTGYYVSGTEMPSISNSATAAENQNREEILQPSASCDVEQKDVMSPSDKMNMNAVDAEAGNNSIPSLASEYCSLSQPNTDTVDPIVHSRAHEFSDTTECHSQLKCTENHTCNGCQRVPLTAAANNFSNNIHKMRQTLCALHRMRRCLRKLQRDNPPICASNTDTLQTDTADMHTLCDVKYKKMRLEAIEHELTSRDLALRQKEEELNLRMQRIEQLEQALHQREQLRQSSLSSGMPENPKSVTGSQSESVTELQTIEGKSSVMPNCRSVRKVMTRRCQPCRLSKQKVVCYSN